jgi:hypothetical protein
MRIISCRCEKTFDADLPEEIDLDREPETLEAILAGDFLVVTCPHCGERIKPDIAISLRSRRTGLTLRVLPEVERATWMMGTPALPKDVDVLLIVEDGLDPRAVEILKYYILAKALEGAPEGGDTPLVRYRGKTEEGKLSFGIEGLREGELALLALPFDRYEKSLKDLPNLAATEPFSSFLFGPHKSIRALESL